MSGADAGASVPEPAACWLAMRWSSCLTSCMLAGRVLRALALEELTVGQALGILAETAERSDDPARTALYQETRAALRQMQAGEP